MAQRAKDFKWKIRIAMIALKTVGVSEFRDIIFPETAFDLDKRKIWLDKLDRYYIGRDSTTDVDLFERVIVALDLPISRNFWISCSAIDFFNRLSQIQKDLVQESGNEELLTKLFETTTEAEGEPRDARLTAGRSGTKATSEPQLRANALKHWYRVIPAYRHPDLDSAMDRGKFDQSYLYLDPNASRRWHELTAVPRRYPTFRSCHNTLCELLKLKKWTALLEARPITNVVVLGAGAAKKDVELLDHLAAAHEVNSKNRVTYMLVDTSFHMLSATAEELERLKGEDYERFLDLVAVIGDFMDLGTVVRTLEEHEVPIHSAGGRTLFWIPGNTIANIDVTKLVEHISSAADPEDLFLIGAEFADTKDLEKYTNTLISHYNHERLRQLVLPPVRAYLDKRKRDFTHNELNSIIKARPAQRYFKPRDLIDKVTVEIVASIDDKEIVLANSSRYDKTDFIKFMKGHGFKAVVHCRDKDDAHFEQTLLTKE